MNRRILPLASLLLLAACGGDAATLRGTLRADQLPGDGSDTLYVWTDPGRRVAVLDGAFALEEVAPGAVTLGFAEGEDSIARMEIGGLPGGVVELRGIRIDRESGLAFPAAVVPEGDAVVTVNGLRYGGRLPERVEAEGAVLAVSGEADALLVRPADGGLPDLRVVVGPLTETLTPDGDPVSAREIEAGDSVRVVGETEAGYVLASRITVPREAALREAGEEDAARSGGRAAERVPVAASPPDGERVREAERRDEERARERRKKEEERLREARKKAEEREREERKKAEERRREREKGRGKG